MQHRSGVNPPARRGANRNEAIYVRLSPEERTQLLGFAGQLGITTSELVRRSFSGYAAELLRRRRVTPDKDDLGQPAESKRSNRKAAVYVRLSPEERTQLVDFAKQLGITPPELVRRSFAGYAADTLRWRKRDRRRESV